MSKKRKLEQSQLAESFEQWFQTLKSQSAGKGNHIRSHAKRIVLLLLLSSFRELAREEKFHGAHKQDVFNEIVDRTGEC